MGPAKEFMNRTLGRIYRAWETGAMLILFAWMAVRNKLYPR